jgi:DNA/RNA endonuclease YhcR with UshA esterase domain
MEAVGQITTYRGEYEVAVGHAIEAKLKEKNG